MPNQDVKFLKKEIVKILNDYFNVGYLKYLVHSFRWIIKYELSP